MSISKIKYVRAYSPVTLYSKVNAQGFLPL